MFGFKTTQKKFDEAMDALKTNSSSANETITATAADIKRKAKLLVILDCVKTTAAVVTAAASIAIYVVVKAK